MCWTENSEFVKFGGYEVMKIIKYTKLLLKEFWSYALEHKSWWIFPLILILLLIGLLIFAGSATAPFIYTLF